jgi:hypothetical protein
VEVENGALVTLRSEEQGWVDGAKAYVSIIRERRGGRLVEASRDTLADDELRAGATWDVDVDPQD